MMQVYRQRVKAAAAMGVVLCTALVVNLGLGLALGLEKPMESDAHYFLQAATSLVDGDGYRIRDTFWPDSPAMSRSPGWPFVVSLGLRLFPSISPDVVMRCLCLFINSLIAVGVFLLAKKLFGRLPVALLAGLGYVVHPVGAYLAYDGGSEPLFIVLLLAGTVMLLGGKCEVSGDRAGVEGGKWKVESGRWQEAGDCGMRIAECGVGGQGTWKVVGGEPCPPPLHSFIPSLSAFLFLGLACLVRPNFLPWVGFFFALVAVRRYRSRAEGRKSKEGEDVRGCGSIGVSEWEKGREGAGKGFRVQGSGGSGEERESSGVRNPTTQQLNNPATRRRQGYGGQAQQLASHPHLAVTLLRPHAVTLLFSCLAAVVLFLMPSFLWALRNYGVSGRFPVLSTLRGQTFYGGNNALTAQTGKWWGYWVFPDGIPGERTMRELAQSMTEWEVDEYYWKRGTQFLVGNPGRIPGLLVGKLVRAYVPIPWNLTSGTGAVSAYRWVLYLVALVGLWFAWNQVDGAYRIVFPAMLMADVTTVLVFWGCVRFAFPLDPFLLPFAAVAVAPWIMGERAVRCRPILEEEGMPVQTPP